MFFLTGNDAGEALRTTVTSTVLAVLYRRSRLMRTTDRRIRTKKEDLMKKRLINRSLAILGVGVLALTGVQSAAFAGEKTCPLRIKGMHCEMCPGKVEAALKSVPGVKSAKVDYKSATANVVVDDSVKPAQLISAVEKAGFHAEPLKPGATSKSQ